MNAIQFIKDHGVEVAREAIDEASTYGGDYLNGKTLELSKYAPSVHAVFIPDLKRLVENVDLVEWFGNDLVGAKQLLEFSKDCKTIELSGSVITVERLEKAIADYEAIGGEHV